ncbi:terminase family protein [Erythrobacter sp. SG61-1L]|uniref:terminase large subunit domain-containing protein n=1 Tax=Erythrobacter sp. SG61-1L TaxID=1603897 RepID=UPI0006C8F220|nr:terminase family protein [Erythrobacter sp. SG61-1L]
MQEPPETDSNVPAPAVPFEARRAARSLYWRGWALTQIAGELGLKYSTVASWCRREKWDAAAPDLRLEEGLLERLLTLVGKEQKTGGDFKEIDLLNRQLDKVERRRKYASGGNETDLNPNIERRNSPAAKAKRSRRKNALTHEDIEKCRALFAEGLFGHQRAWWEASGQTIRFILKSRQIGATWYFAREAFMRGMETGNNQIFLSASKNQAEIFRSYIQDFVFAATGIELKGNPLVINRQDEQGNQLEPVTFYFLATNLRTAQGYNGDVYLDECFWLPGFLSFEAAASAMASQKFYRLTYFSTPSTVTHGAYGKWSGEEWNKGRPKAERQRFDTSHKALKQGAVGPDGIWRQIVTIDDAEEQGFDRFDREALQRRYSVEEFGNKFLCLFVDDTQSAFTWAMLQPAMVDAFYKWKDFKPAAPRPFGDKPVWLGFDPNDQGRDNAQIMVVAPPDRPGGKFRLLEKQKVDGDFAAQNRALQQMARRYNVTDIAIENSAFGSAVYQQVVKWFPLARKVDYSITGKAHMVMKAQNLLRAGRIEIPIEFGDVRDSFMMIRPSLTSSGKQLTYVSGRSGELGHADIAWATMHALINEPLGVEDGGTRKAKVEFFQ